MSDEKNATIEGLEIDFADFSYGDKIELVKIDLTVERTQLMARQINAGNNDPEIFREYLALNSEAHLERTFCQVRVLFSKVVKKLPKEWLVVGAPDLPLSDPDLYFHLRSDKLSVLRKLVSEAENPDSKN